MKFKKDRIFKRRLIVLASSFLFLFSCSHHALVPIANEDQFIQLVRKKNPTVRSLKGNGSIAVVTKEKTYRFKVGILMNDRNMFIETYGFGVPQVYVSLFEDKLKILNPGQKEVYVGTSSSSLQKFLNIAVKPKDLFSPLLRHYLPKSNSKISPNDREQRYIMEEINRDQYWVDSHFNIRKIFQSNAALNQIEYSAPIDPETLFPKKIKIDLQGESIEITFDRAEINTVIDAKLFQIDIPESNFHVYSIDSN